MFSELPGTPRTLAEVLDDRARRHPERVAYSFLDDGEVESGVLTFADLRSRALALAAHLAALHARGERAVLVYPAGLDFVVAFFACLYAGVVAVPAGMPSRKRGVEILRRIVADARAKWVLSSADALEQIAPELGGGPDAPAYVDTGAKFDLGEPAPALPVVEPGEPALLQYTSGSTGSPRGVVVTHENLVDNQRQIELSFRHPGDSCAVSWLPMFHDMGLGTALGSVWQGIQCVLMSPRAFLQDPRRWLRAISRYRATISGGPDFAYDLCVRRIGAAEREGLDLSSWRVAYNGSEPVRASTLDRFSEAFAACGFRREAFHPVYGLAEATLLVTSEPADQPPLVAHFSEEALIRGLATRSREGGARHALVACGGTGPGTRLLIVDPETRVERPAGQIGEIWVQGGSVAAGYWGKPADTQESFGCTTAAGLGPFLRTGDLGFLDDDHLFVTGRLKDLIIVRGRNHYPQDVEDSASTSHPALVPYACAAFSVDTDQGEELVIVQEVARAALRTLDVPGVVRAIRAAVSEHHALHTHAVVLLKPATLPRTTSGKVRRKECRQAFLEHSLPDVAAWVAPASPLADADAEPDSRRRESTQRADRLIEWIRRHAADLIHAHTSREHSPAPEPILRDFAKQGLLGMQVDPEYGGLGLSHSDSVRVLEQLAAFDFTLALFVGLNNCLGIQPVAKYARPSIKALLLPGLAHGQDLAAFALEEPSGTPPGAMGVQAQADGEDGWRLFGTKYLDGAAQGAGTINVFARHEEPPGVSAFVVSDQLEGLRKVRDGLSMGVLGFTRDTIALEGVAVGRENLLGNLGSGMDIAREAAMLTRLAIGAACVGGMKRCAQLVKAEGPYYGNVNGKLTPNPVTLSRLGSLTTRITGLECLVQCLARALDAGHGVSSEAFAACKLLGQELLLRCIDDLMQVGVHGGYAETTRLSALYRDAGLLRNFDGPAESVAELVGSGVMASDASLRVLVEEVLRAPAVLGFIAPAIDTVRQRMAVLHGALAPRAQRWGHTRAGELTTWLILLAAVEGSAGMLAGQELARTRAWARAQLEHALAMVRFGTPSEMATLDSSDVARTFAAYAQTLGEPVLEGSASLEGERVSGAFRAAFAGSFPGSAEAQAHEAAKREIRSWLISWLARRLQIAVSEVEPGRSFADHGLDSVAAVELAKALSDRLGRELNETLLWSFPTIDVLVEYLLRAAAGQTPNPPEAVEPASPAAPREAPGSELDDELARLERELRSR